MFTGIITSVETVIKQSKGNSLLKLTINKPSKYILQKGDSISINGVCLTIVSFTDKNFSVELIQETLDKTTFGVNIPKKVNLEQSLTFGQKVNGHIVQGHVDTTGIIKNVINDHKSKNLTILFPKKYKKLIVEKGSVAINGVSLTVFNVTDKTFDVALIPHTLSHTTFGKSAVSDAVNIEFDIVGKYLFKK